MSNLSSNIRQPILINSLFLAGYVLIIGTQYAYEEPEFESSIEKIIPEL